LNSFVEAELFFGLLKILVFLVPSPSSIPRESTWRFPTDIERCISTKSPDPFCGGKDSCFYFVCSLKVFSISFIAATHSTVSSIVWEQEALGLQILNSVLGDGNCFSFVCSSREVTLLMRSSSYRGPLR
jgi:hypothetical protein